LLILQNICGYFVLLAKVKEKSAEDQSINAQMTYSIERILWFLVFLVAGKILAQQPDSVGRAETFLQDSLTMDSLAIDSLETDSIVGDSLVRTSYKLSQNGFDAPVYYNARDSMFFDVKAEELHLFGEAYLEYTTISLKANKIIYHWSTGIMEAFHGLDSAGTKIEIPEFKDGDQEFRADRMRYNFKTNKGMVYDVVTQEGDMYIRGGKTKFSREQVDTTTQDIVYSSDAIFTTCNHDVPHYGIISKKQKIVPNKEVIIGPSVLKIRGVPTPLVLPFGFFPITSDRKAGLLVPNDYSYNDNWGYGIENLGFYLPISDYLDATFYAKYYFNGTWGGSTALNFNKRYKFSGSANLEYNQLKQEIVLDTVLATETQNSYRINFSLNQASGAHPNFNMGGSINLSGNNNDQRNDFSSQSQLNNNISSNFRFSKRFPYSPFSLNVNIRNAQNIQTRVMDLTLPSVRLNMQKIYPFQQKERVGAPKWYEDIYLDYDLDASNSVRTTDTTLFTQETLDAMTYGLSHNVSTGKSVKLFKYFSLNPSVRYREIWNFQGLDKSFTDSIAIYQDTTFLDEAKTEIESIEEIRDTIVDIFDNRIQEFTTFRDLDLSASLTTKLFGTMLFEKGWLRGLRHTITPTFSFSYKPSLGNFEETFLKTLETPLDTLEYNTTSQFAYLSVSAREQMTLNYSISDFFQGKKFNKRDSIEEKFDILKRITFNGSYDFLADSLHFSDPSLRVTTQLFRLTNFAFSWSWSYYDQNEQGRTIDEFYYNNTGKLMRSKGGNFTLNTSFSIPRLIALFGNQGNQGIDLTEEKEDDEAMENELWKLLKEINFRHGYRFVWRIRDDKTVGKVGNHTLSFQGNIPLTENWNIRVGNVGWDFLAKNLTYPDVTFARDLHCWEMSLSWQPRFNAYNFAIRVKPSTLGFIELPYKRNAFENGF
jgi:lipopolysaccharide export system protein LptA